MKKGFTVIELLATIIILGIIGTIGVAIFDKVIHNMRLKAYETQKQNFILSSERWLNDKKGTSEFPKKEELNSEVSYKLSLRKLLKDSYIDKDICNQEDRLKIDYDNSYVEISVNGKIYDYKLNIVNTEEECKWYIHQSIMII